MKDGDRAIEAGTPSLWQEQHPGRPFAPLAGTHRSEVCVIGAGVTGAACAWRLLEQGLPVAVVDGRRAAGSASGRNGGFAVTGSSLHHPELEERLGAQRARALQSATERELDRMIALAAELGVPQAVRRTGSLWVGGDAEAAEITRTVALASAAGIECRLAPERIPEPMRATHHTAALFPLDAELLPAAWVRTLVAAGAERGAAVFEGSAVTELARDGSGWAVTAGAGRVSADAVVAACDGLIPRLLPQLEGFIYPVRGQVAATAPLERNPLELPTHSQHGFMYYRPTAEGRVVVGGGRLPHLAEEYTDAEHVTPAVQAELDAFLAGPLGLAGVEVTHRWAGIMGFAADLLPVVGQLPGSPGVYVAGGYSGVGNVIGHQCGTIVADLIATGCHPDADAYDIGRLDLAARPDQLEKRRSRELAGA